MKKWLIFTDLDGTLLDHRDYNYAEALPALEKITALQIPLIINSSKTSAEIEAIKARLHNNGAFAVENGAAVFIPAELNSESDGAINRVILGRPISDILSLTHAIRNRYGFSFRGFSDFSVDEVMRETGLTEKEARQAKQRLASEPLKWYDSEEKRLLFEHLLKEQGLQLVKGGRFWHVMGQNDKGKAMAWLLNKYQQQQTQKIMTIALGDSQNDLPMLEQADYAAVIQRTDGSYLTVNKKADRLVRSRHPAPLGWREAIEQLFKKLKLGEMNE
ncbi:HAD-IIB family hydrolase [Methylomarinum vadi]|uniref:HAD-IIB family hydrolase n=1 Tax=Methylomarinum vadi TaxID=438855 RepID=UPI00056B339A|nr:HAD-IIB family hydrolase [Methylomarinum vadi]